jgi:hypothetical protein
MPKNDPISPEERDADAAETAAWQAMSTQDQAAALATDDVYAAEVRQAVSDGDPVDYRDWQTDQAYQNDNRRQ